VASHLSERLIGFRVMGPHGELGRVVECEVGRGVRVPTITVRGGASDSLVYHVPTERLRSVSRDTRTVTVEVDVTDFVPRLAKNGTVDLHVAP
jgi:hypothetical protein